MKSAQGIEQKEKTQDKPYDLQRLSFDEHPNNEIDDVKDESCDDERDEYGEHGGDRFVVGGY
ncbi:MAG: hypothetical protein ABSE62_00930 [Chthoniobacteraceae bacterium]